MPSWKGLSISFYFKQEQSQHGHSFSQLERGLPRPFPFLRGKGLVHLLIWEYIRSPWSFPTLLGRGLATTLLPSLRKQKKEEYHKQVVTHSTTASKSTKHTLFCRLCDESGVRYDVWNTHIGTKQHLKVKGYTITLPNMPSAMALATKEQKRHCPS